MGVGEGLQFSYVKEFGRLFQYLCTHRSEIDFVHYFSTLLVLFGPLLARLAGVRCIVTITGFGRVFTSEAWKYRLLRPIYFALLAMVIRLTERILAQNHSDYQSLIERFPKLSSKFVYIGSAVSIPVVDQKDFFQPKIRVLLVARLLPDKGIDHFLRVAETLYQGNFEFILIGPRSVGHDELWKKVQDYHNRKVIDYKGELGSDATLEQFSQAHVLFFPSFGEGMSRVMLEAGFACACPLAYDIPANRDLVAHGGGRLVSLGDLDSICHILMQWEQNRQELRKNALTYQTHIVNNYNMDVYTKRMDDLLIKLSQEMWGRKL
jgi:glycosyltransferase involved in cell wall biosynthesis